MKEEDGEGRVCTEGSNSGWACKGKGDSVEGEGVGEER